MQATNLDLIGESKWGQMMLRHLYSDGTGQKYVRVNRRGSLRARMVPYRDFANDFMAFSYIMEREVRDGSIRGGNKQP